MFSRGYGSLVVSEGLKTADREGVRTMPTTPDPLSEAHPGRKTLVIDLKSEFDLACHCIGKAGWQEKQFSSRKNRVLIGNNQQEAQIQIPDCEPDSIQAAALRLGECWLVLETGKQDLMRVNGFPRRQAIIGRRSRTAVTFGESAVVFMAGTVEENHALLPEGNRALVKFAGQPLAMALDQPLLIGNHPACALRLDQLFAGQKADAALKAIFAAPFVAVLCSGNGRLYLSPLGRAKLQLDGEPVVGTVPLPTNSTLGIDKLALPIVLPESLQGTELDIPDYREQRLALVQLNEDGRPLGKVELKTAGHSMIIGRAAENAEIIIPVDEVSRKHAQIIIYDKSLLLEDCYSSNGTFVNDEKVGRCRVRPGDVMRFGGSPQFLLCYAFSEDLPGMPED